MSEQLPVIDISAAVNGGPTDAVTTAIDAALTEVGFLQIVGHGVDASLLDAAYVATESLAGCPMAVKEALRSPSGHPFRGWNSYLRGDGVTLVERFQVCSFDDADDARRGGIAEQYLDWFTPNVWPGETLAGFDEAWRACFAAARRLGGTVMSLFAQALHLEPTYFTAMCETDTSAFAANVYPGLVGDSSGDLVIFPEHSDSGTLTLLHQRGNYEGLEIRLTSGDWARVPVIEEAFVVNIGQLMTRWTNDAWRATPHRVVAGTRPGERRVSLTTFHAPAIDTKIAPLPTTIGDDGPHYEPVTPYEWEHIYLESYQRRAG